MFKKIKDSFMSIKSLKELKIGNLIAKIPIIQGGMGVGISLSGLASSVANEGGIGVISVAGIGMKESDFFKNFLGSNIRALKDEIRKARGLSKGILGVNIMVALTNFADMVKTAIEEKIDIIFAGAGLPLNLPKYLNANSKTKLVPIVSSGRAARIISERWYKQYNYLPDAIVVEGPMAGGHLGFKPEQINDPAYSLEKLVPDVVMEMQKFEEKYKRSIPIIAAGGIYTGEDIHKFIKLGASGVQMATRFVATDECDASIKFKQAYVDAGKDDVVIIKSPVGMPGRAIRNNFIDDINIGKMKQIVCPYHCIATCDYKKSPYCIVLALINAQKGRLKNGFAFAGETVHKIKEIISVKKLMAILSSEYKNATN
jgi:NAD(P)H-dependent flavin oxidoreductase YrpB (nitropropane dioxygenase family)